jgi:aminopeptidase N
MENNTLVTVHRDWLDGEISGFAHEAAHHWFGNTFNCATWSDIWINEGGATWCEGLFDAYPDIEPQNVGNYLGMYKSLYLYMDNEAVRTTPLYNPDTGEIFDNLYPLVYYKGAWIYQMLYLQYGDEFIGFLRYLLDEYRNKPIETKDFHVELKSYMENNHVAKYLCTVDEFFDMWVYSGGHPVYDVEARITESESDTGLVFTAHVELTQTKFWGEGENPYKLPVEIMFLDKFEQGAKYFSVTVDNFEKVQNYEFEVPYLPAYVGIGYDGGLANDRYTNIINETSVENRDNHGITLYPNPVDKGSNLAVKPGSDIIQNATVYTTDGRLIHETGSSYNELLNIPTRNLSPGLYFLKINSGNEVVNLQFIVR